MSIDLRAVAIASCVWTLPMLALTPWVADREVPYRILSVQAAAPGVPGGWLVIRKTIARQQYRDCALTFTRFAIDSSQVIYWIDSGYMSSSNRNKLPPDSSNTGFQIPETMAPGRATLYSDYSYRCNPVHDLWPIRTSEVVEFEVVPR